jgi:hypothetical protein
MSVQPESTSYFSTPATELDPFLFDGDHLKPWIRHGILDLLESCLAQYFRGPETWTRAWIAGSGVSFQWQAARNPGDLDVLVGVNYPIFRSINQDYSGLSDNEISKTINDIMREHIMPMTADWHGYEMTFYVNPDSFDIRAINPYAAYDLSHDSWTVHADPRAHAPHTRSWENRTDNDHRRTVDLVRRYQNALLGVRNATNPAHRVNAEQRLNLAVEEAVDLFDEIHTGRKIAFSRTGAGYADFNNYRWQSGKAKGTIPALKAIKDYHDDKKTNHDLDTYGIELPDSETLVRRAASMYLSTMGDE